MMEKVVYDGYRVEISFLLLISSVLVTLLEAII